MLKTTPLKWGTSYRHSLPEDRMTIGTEFVTRDTGIYFLDFLRVGYWDRETDQSNFDSCYRRTHMEEAIWSNENSFSLQYGEHPSEISYYVETELFVLRREECSTWLKWAPFFPPYGENVMALTLRNSTIDPNGPQKRGVNSWFSDTIEEFFIEPRKPPGLHILTRSYDVHNATHFN